jgi:hypothetical protein
MWWIGGVWHHLSTILSSIFYLIVRKSEVGNELLLSLFNLLSNYKHVLELFYAQI